MSYDQSTQQKAAKKVIFTTIVGLVIRKQFRMNNTDRMDEAELNISFRNGYPRLNASLTTSKDADFWDRNISIPMKILELANLGNDILKCIETKDTYTTVFKNLDYNSTADEKPIIVIGEVTISFNGNAIVILLKDTKGKSIDFEITMDSKWYGAKKNNEDITMSVEKNLDYAKIYAESIKALAHSYMVSYSLKHQTNEKIV